MTKKKRLLIGLFLLAGILAIFIFIRIAYFPTLHQRLKSPKDFGEARNDLSGIRVAIYFGHGMDAHSALAIGRAVQWMGCSEVKLVNADNIKSGSLSHTKMRMSRSLPHTR